MEAADCIIENEAREQKPLEKIHTPDVKTIEELCQFLKIDAKNLAKAVVYQKNMTDEYVVVFIRGDLEVNETKLRNYLGEEIHPGIVTEESGIVAGFIGPMGLPKNVTVVYDASIKGLEDAVCGACEVEVATGVTSSYDILESICRFAVFGEPAAEPCEGFDCLSGYCTVCHRANVEKEVAAGGSASIEHFNDLLNRVGIGCCFFGIKVTPGEAVECHACFPISAVRGGDAFLGSEEVLLHFASVVDEHIGLKLAELIVAVYGVPTLGACHRVGHIIPKNVYFAVIGQKFCYLIKHIFTILCHIAF
jgi:prolyl-tRNA editing enzyme YbaK/EbsC (Cys-tRNA(Pro) deacylase)